MACGVLALQGDFAAHAAVLGRLGLAPYEVRSAAELARAEALVLPGGESSTMLRLLTDGGLFEPLAAAVARGVPTLGTCAGLILLARRVEPEQPSLGVLDVDVVRNAYGRQVHSAVRPVRLAPELGEPDQVEGVFIRAPRITRVGPAVEVLATVDDEPVLVRQGAVVGASYHPELSADDRAHALLATVRA